MYTHLRYRVGMHPSKGPATDVEASAWRAELNALLGSRLFIRAPTMSKIIAYVCEQSSLGNAIELKEYNIGVEALGRNKDFLPEVDSIVRVEFSRLRKRLQQYYETEGAGHEFQIRLPEAGYAPVLVPRQAATNGPSLSDGGTQRNAASEAPPLAPQENAVAAPDMPSLTPGGRGIPAKRRVLIVAAASVILGLVAVLAIAPRFERGGRPSVALPPGPTAAPQDRTGSIDEAGIRIRAGSTGPRYLDLMNRAWGTDRFYSGGSVASVPVVRRVFGTQDQALYSTFRWGNFSYDIPLKEGIYELRLHFCQDWDENFNTTSDGVDTRRFRVFINGTLVLDDFDIVADAGGANIADERVFKDVSPSKDGFLHLQFVGLRGAAILNGIEISPGTPGKLRPIRIHCGAGSSYEAAGEFWTADRYFRGGTALKRIIRTLKGSQADVLGAERYGHFRYSIPVASGRYALTLEFIEAVFGEAQPGTGAGRRIFDVYCNGLPLLRNFDIFKEAGGAVTPVSRTFRGLKPNAQSKLDLLFVPVLNYATVSAIQVLDESP